MNSDTHFFAALASISESNPQGHAILASAKKPLTYSDLVKQIRYCADALKTMGLDKNSRIGVVLPNGPVMGTCCLGVMAAATCAPLNPAYQADEFRFYLEDIGANAIILPAGSKSPAKAVAEKLEIPVIELVTDEQDAAGAFHFRGYETEETRTATPANTDGIALILHTSGTTSRPKIVPLSQKNLYISACNIIKTLDLTPADTCLNLMPLFHIHGLVAALLSSLVSGGSVVCTSGFSTQEFPVWLPDFNPSWYTAVPTIHQAILGMYEDQNVSSAPHSFRFIRSSSSALPPATLAALFKLFNAPVIEAYGMTEAAHQMTSNPLPPKQCKPGSVGLPAGPAVSIMNAAGELLATGERGEIVIQGDNVTAGYENNPQANQGAYTKGWFRTGDQGYFDEDGYLFISGRLKEIINRGGEKISPREIDETLLEHASVSQAVAFPVPHDSLGEDIVAAVILKPGSVTSTEELRAYLFERMAGYKVPSRIILVDDIPKGATGKIQRIKLASLLTEFLAPEFEAASNENEELIISIFEEVLRIKNVGVHDNFFALGGDSLKATQVVSRINEKLDIDLPPPELFLHPTTKELAITVEKTLNARQEKLALLMDEISFLSDEEVEKLLKDG